MRVKLEIAASWIDDPDPPDEMTDEEIERAAEAVARFMKQHASSHVSERTNIAAK